MNIKSNETFSKANLTLTQSSKHHELKLKLLDDTSKLNSFSYTNALCLNNNLNIVEQQFTRFLEFIESQRIKKIKNELKKIINPLICRLYIELLKGKEPNPAIEFLKHFAHIIDPLEYLGENGQHTNGSTLAGAATESDDPIAMEIQSITTELPETNSINTTTTTTTLNISPSIGISTEVPLTATESCKENVSIKMNLLPNTETTTENTFSSTNILPNNETQQMVTIAQSSMIEYPLTIKIPSDGHDIPLTIEIPSSLIHDNVPMDDDDNNRTLSGIILKPEITLRPPEEPIKYETILTNDIENPINMNENNVNEMEFHQLMLPEIAPKSEFQQQHNKLLDDNYQQAKINGKSSLNIKPMDVENEYFKNLIQMLSVCLDINALDDYEITKKFRYTKYEIKLSLKSVDVLRTYFANCGHIIIMHILHSWFAIDIIEFKDSSDELYKMPFNGWQDDDQKNHNTFTESNSNGINSINESIGYGDQSTFIKPLPINNSTFKKNQIFDCPFNEKPNSFSINHLQSLRDVVEEINVHQYPIKTYNVGSDDIRLVTADVDPRECHLACGFDNSIIKLWSLKSTKYYGRKPYEDIQSKLCEWNLNSIISNASNNNENENDDDDDDDDDGDGVADGIDRNECEDDDNDINCFIKNNFRNKIYDSCTNGVTLRGHNRGITDLLFSKKYPILVSVAKDNEMRLWNSSNYQCAAVYRGHNYPIWCVAENSIGSYLATGSRDRTARLWSTDRLYPLQTYIGHTKDVEAIAFHPNGSYFATGSNDLTVRLWCVTSGKLLRIFTDCRSSIKCICFSPDGKLLATGGEGSKIRILDIAQGSQINELKGHTSTVTSLAWHKNGTRLASCTVDGTVRIFDVNKIEQKASHKIKSSKSNATKLKLANQSIRPMADVCPNANYSNGNDINHNNDTNMINDNTNNNGDNTTHNIHAKKKKSTIDRLIVEHLNLCTKGTKVLFNLNNYSLTCIGSH